jgi:acetylglutamate kinase
MMKTLHVVKIGGNIIDNEAALLAFLKDFSQIPGDKILVHGGGKIATQMGEKLGIPQELIDGRRVTSAETLDLITMVYAGLIGKRIVALLQSLNTNALGLTGADGNAILGQKRLVKTVDYGFVADVEPSGVNQQAIQQWLSAGFTPVFAALSHDGQGHLLNTNADRVAAVLAMAMADTYEVHLKYCFEKNGVLQDIHDNDSYLRTLDKSQFESYVSQGIIQQGMIPKLDNAAQAAQKVASVGILHADHLLKSIQENTIYGTSIL